MYVGLKLLAAGAMQDNVRRGIKALLGMFVRLP